MYPTKGLTYLVTLEEAFKSNKFLNNTVFKLIISNISMCRKFRLRCYILPFILVMKCIFAQPTGIQ